MPFYANTHTEASLTGRVTTSLREQAKQMIRKACGASKEEHAVIFAGSGSTAAIALMARVLCERAGGRCSQASSSSPPISKHSSLFRLKKKSTATKKGKCITVLVGPYEHHSNILLWKESGVHVITVALSADGRLDLNDMEKHLKKLSKDKHQTMIVGSISAGSNVTGMLLNMTCSSA